MVGDSILKGKKIVLCVTGSVAAIEAPKLARELRRSGADVFCVMSKSAKGIIHPDVLEWASEREVVTKITGKVEHVKLAGDIPEKADLVVIAPCTANTLGKIAAGIDDTPVTTLVTTAFGSKIPLLVVPAMHGSMYKHPIVLENIAKLKKLGVVVMEPKLEEGKAKFPGINHVVTEIKGCLSKKDLLGKKILVTAGPTAEDIDDIRYISNKSSGKMGVWLAEEAVARGAKVVLVRGNTMVEPNCVLKDINVKSAQELFAAIKENINADVIIHAAAVSDYTVEKQGGKISSEKGLALELTPTTKVLEKIKELNSSIFLIG
ncbi:MAG: bifunctional phosphopantothenoylcysteine decarboxylase/phosphopantothenate--cysteine ligase CoaBC, partial [archaeon]|nr:bifunctional phosphopantothenoylcysteine decarboxylase/phosphopantothenate--cysteine ligase CoaBC [archaeon]